MIHVLSDAKSLFLILLKKKFFLTPVKPTVKVDPKKTPTLKDNFNKLRAAALLCPSLCVDVIKIDMAALPACFRKSSKSQLLKIFDPTPSLTLALKKDALILDFSEIKNFQAAVATAKTFHEFADGI